MADWAADMAVSVCGLWAKATRAEGWRGGAGVCRDTGL